MNLIRAMMNDANATDPACALKVLQKAYITSADPSADASELKQQVPTEMNRVIQEQYSKNAVIQRTPNNM